MEKSLLQKAILDTAGKRHKENLKELESNPIGKQYKDLMKKSDTTIVSFCGLVVAVAEQMKIVTGKQASQIGELAGKIMTEHIMYLNEKRKRTKKGA